MLTSPMTDLVGALRRDVLRREVTELSDSDLLGRFLARRDEAAFAALVQRHGAMVLGVCRRVVGQAQDAEDAFQATFLVLARKAASVQPREAVGRWLYGVAYHTALKARAAAAKRRAKERQAFPRGAPSAPDRGTEIRAVLDQELSRLPDDYRAAVVLCDLEGLTRREAAVQLGWPEGTVAGRLARARDLLASRLTRRGVALSSGGLATVLAEETVSAAPSLAMVLSALQAALTSKAPPAVAVLANSVLHAGFTTWLLSAALLIVVLGLGGAGVCFHAANAAGDPIADNPPGGQEPPEIIKPAIEAQVKKPGTTLRAPGSGTFEVALSADGKLLARGGWDHVVDLWDVASGKKLHTLKGHTATIFRLAFSPDGTTLASIATSWGPGQENAAPGQMKLWDVATGKERVTLKGLPGSGLCLAFSSDGKTLATSSANDLGKGRFEDTVKLWDVDTGKEKLELKQGKGVVAFSLAFSPDGKTLAMGTGGGIMDITPSPVILWDVSNGKERARTLPAHKNSITWVGFSPDGKTLASACGGKGVDKDESGKRPAGEIKLWDVDTAKERTTIPTRMVGPLQFFSLAFTADGKTLISAMWSVDEMKNEGGLVVDHWELATGKARATFWAPQSNDMERGAGTKAGAPFSALSADGKTVAWGGAEEKDKEITGTAHVWEVGSLATSAPKLSDDPEELPAEKAPASNADLTTDLDKLQGSWRVISSQVADDIAAQDEVKKRKVTVKGNQLIYEYGNERKEQQNGTLKVDSKTKALDWTWELPGRPTMLGIYELNGDELKIGFPNDRPVQVRPTRWVIGKDDVVWLLVLKRAAPDPVSDEMKKLEGTWLPIAMESGGEKVQGEELKKYDWAQFVWTIRDGKWQQRDKEETRAASLTVDPTKKPKTMDRVIPEGEAKGLVARSLYELDGDILRVCTNFEFEDRRPKGFNAPGTFTFTFKRKIEIKELKPAAEPKGNPRPLLSKDLSGIWQNEKPEAAWHKLSDNHKNQFGGKPWKKVELEIKKLVDSPDPQGRTHSAQLSFLKPDDELFSFGIERVEIREEKGKRLFVITNLDKFEYRIEYEFKNGKLQMRGSYLRREPFSGAIFVPEVFDGDYVAIPTTKAGGADVKQPAPKETGDGWVSLFNRKDLTGWKTHPLVPGDWRVEDGILIGRGPNVSHLYTERGDYEDLHFRIEAKINAGGNSGQSFRKQFSAKIGGDGYEAQIDSSSHKAKTGSLYIHLSPAVAVEQVLVPLDTWFTQEVIVRGNHIVILVNGQKTVDFIDKNHNYARGHLALQVYDPATVVQFRKIEIKELKPDSTTSDAKHPSRFDR